MMIHWFDAKTRVGQASLYLSNITLNVEASVPFEFAYKVQVGLNEDGNIVIEPLSKERVLRGDLDEYSLLNIKMAKSYSRIASKELMRHLVEETGLKLDDKEALRFKTKWDEKSNLLIVLIKEVAQ
ncbi:MAG: hypothetical protein LKF75_01355 [Bacilli bacterium]|jgi:hypothetical protein|nr:hypothetical protein [Bacilli bacterium]MCH4228340.1 hypothetical protein [Bacilli bacterium]MCH4278401.1 hypothetical protein [Bacilli bacterium]MCI2054845.1 hypothetical protein [Bacilli bacterium]